MKFQIVKRPVVTYRHRGVQRAPHIQAVLDTFSSGKAVTFDTVAEAKRAYVGATGAIRRQHPDQRVRIFDRTVWVEARKKGKS